MTNSKWIDSSRIFKDSEVYVNAGFDTDKIGQAYVMGPVCGDGTVPVRFDGSNRISWVPLKSLS
jgi:hypothetical protein